MLTSTPHPLGSRGKEQPVSAAGVGWEEQGGPALGVADHSGLATGRGMASPPLPWEVQGHWCPGRTHSGSHLGETLLSPPHDTGQCPEKPRLSQWEMGGH